MGNPWLCHYSHPECSVKLYCLPLPSPALPLPCPSPAQCPCPGRPALPLPHVPRQTDPSFLETWTNKQTPHFLRPGRTDTHTPCRFRLLVFTHDAARGTNDFLWGIFCLQNPTVRAGFRSRNPTVRAGSASQLKRGTVVGRTDASTHTHVVIIYEIVIIYIHLLTS